MLAQHILIVEDDMQLLRLYGKILTSEGHHVHEAATLQAARYLLGKHHYDVCIFDLQIGLHTGTELLAMMPVLKSRGMRPIAMSGHEKFRDACAHIGVDFYLKPVAKADLVAAAVAQLQ